MHRQRRVTFNIHCHILPGLDDGSDNSEESLRMLHLVVDGGTNAISSTLHSNIPDSCLNCRNKDYAENFKALKARLTKNIPSPRNKRSLPLTVH